MTDSAPDPIAHEIWDMKYRLRGPDGRPLDRNIEDSWRRVAKALAAPEAEPQAWEKTFFEAMHGFKFMPAGRILAGAGSGRNVTLFNCFVMGTIPDDMSGIFAHLREAALTLQQGGGIGYDFSSLRPKGAPVAGVGADASGPLSFMEVWDAMCRTIMSAGSRRGAMMGTLRCDHPDIEDFVTAKSMPGRLTNFNLSVLVTEAFMQAVREDASWELSFAGTTYRVVSARALWDRILHSTYDSSEPGVIFIDRINQRNNLAYCETIAATNPCGEQPLPPYGACLLGSINLASLVRDGFTAKARLDEAELERLTRIAVRMLDNAIEVSRFPLEAQRQEAQAKRRIGLGVTGLGDALILCGLVYGEGKAVEATERWMGLLRRAAYLASADLAAEKGAFPLFDRDKFLAGETLRTLDQDLRTAIAEKGLRNGLLTSIAPTGTISLLADNLSSGLEPVFAFEYTRQVTQPDGSRHAESVQDHAYRLFRARFGAARRLSCRGVSRRGFSRRALRGREGGFAGVFGGLAVDFFLGQAPGFLGGALLVLDGAALGLLPGKDQGALAGFALGRGQIAQGLRLAGIEAFQRLEARGAGFGHLTGLARLEGALALDLDLHGLAAAVAEALTDLTGFNRLLQLQLLGAAKAQRSLAFGFLGRAHDFKRSLPARSGR